MAAIHVGGQLVQQVTLVGNALGAKIPEVMMRVADRDLRLQGRFLGQRQPVVSSIRHRGSSACSDFRLLRAGSILGRHRPANVSKPVYTVLAFSDRIAMLRRWMNARARGRSMILGSGQFKYRVSAEWAKLPDGWSFKEVAAVGVDSHDRVYTFNRGEHPMMVFDREGNFLRSWGER